MKQALVIVLVLGLLGPSTLYSAGSEAPPIRGICLSAPGVNGMPAFLEFVENELAPARVNTMVLRVDFNFAYQSHPELRNPNPLTREQVAKLTALCQRLDIDLIPQLNLLGHQSWAGSIGNLLRVYPEFDETPHIKMPEEYKWPNEDGLYCKSYCPLHPKVHDVVFALVDELMEAFEAQAFHAGMDEVFYLGDDRCPRCAGPSKAELFAGEVTRIRNHLARSKRRLWIWGDRLLDGNTTGIGMWEASENDTHAAIDRIPKDITICDWHYERAVPTAPYFALKGFDVISCPWRKAEVAEQQWQAMQTFRSQSPPKLAERFLGVMQTVWSGSESFIRRYRQKAPADEQGLSDVECFRRLSQVWKADSASPPIPRKLQPYLRNSK